MTAFDLPHGKTPYQDIPPFWRDAFSHLMRLEGAGLSLHREDRGNFTSDGRLIGSKFGVTPGALAAFVRVSDATLTRDDMESVTAERAMEIAYGDYVAGPGFDTLPADAFAEFFVDWGYNSGPRAAIREMQRLIGATPDGILGNLTRAAVGNYVTSARYVREGHAWTGLDAAVHHACDAREGFYDRIIARRPSQARFRRGWMARVESFRPTTRGTPPLAGPAPKAEMPNSVPRPPRRPEAAKTSTQAAGVLAGAGGTAVAVAEAQGVVSFLRDLGTGETALMIAGVVALLGFVAWRVLKDRREHDA